MAAMTTPLSRKAALRPTKHLTVSQAIILAAVCSCFSVTITELHHYTISTASLSHHMLQVADDAVTINALMKRNVTSKINSETKIMPTTSNNVVNNDDGGTDNKLDANEFSDEHNDQNHEANEEADVLDSEENEDEEGDEGDDKEDEEGDEGDDKEDKENDEGDDKEDEEGDEGDDKEDKGSDEGDDKEDEEGDEGDDKEDKGSDEGDGKADEEGDEGNDKEDKENDEGDDKEDEEGDVSNKHLNVEIVGFKTEDRTIVKSSQLKGTEFRNGTVDPEITVVRNNVTSPNIAWLMSFPNSGTSFTIHMTREASNTTTATNYAMEGDIKELASTQAILGEKGKNGPFLELIRNRFTNVPQTIMTKTHCTGFCSLCGPKKLLFETPRTFLRGCLTGTRAVYTKNGLEEIDVIYDQSLVTKAIHLFRHPLDNIVARFHLEYNEQRAAGNDKHTETFPKNATGFSRWCRRSDQVTSLLESSYIDEPLKNFLRKIPCFNEFFKFTQWHNMAFYVSKDHLKIPTLLLHYHEYSDNFEMARDKVLQFLGLPLVGMGIQFHAGKTYRDYYTDAQKQAIYNFLQEYSSPDTWEQLKNYDFEISSDFVKEQ